MTARLAILAPILAVAACTHQPTELDLTDYRNRVCDLLTPTQLAGFNITQPGTPGADPTRPTCLWHSSDTRILLSLDPYSDTSPVDENANKINGFPSTHWGIPGTGTKLACATTITIRHRQTFTVTVYTPHALRRLRHHRQPGDRHRPLPPMTHLGDFAYTPHRRPLPCLTVGATPLGPAGSGLGLYISLPQGGGGQLSVDPSGVETLITYLEQAQRRLRDIENDARRLTQLEPPGDDPFSPIAVADIKRVAGEDPGGHLYANFKAQDVFQATIDNLRSSLAAYRESESRNAERFRGGT